MTYSRTEHVQKFEFLSTALKRHPAVISIDPSEAICASGICRIIKDGRPLYNDDAHPAYSHAKFYQAIIADALASETTIQR